MHVTMRHYSGSGAKELADIAEKGPASLESAMRKTPNLVSYNLVRVPDGVISITVCKDKAGTDESAKLAAGWVKEHGGHLKVSPPQVTQGPVIVHAK